MPAKRRALGMSDVPPLWCGGSHVAHNRAHKLPHAARDLHAGLLASSRWISTRRLPMSALQSFRACAHQGWRGCRPHSGPQAHPPFRPLGTHRPQETQSISDHLRMCVQSLASIEGAYLDSERPIHSLLTFQAKSSQSYPLNHLCYQRCSGLA